MPSMEGAHRLDLLIEEQTSAVKNVQSGLQQSLALLEHANSKEERESARMQVKSLLSRAEEFLFLLRVICEMRAELGYVQRELTQAKRDRVNAQPLYARLQWLELRLEKLLLAKRRSRPGARGQRTQQLPAVKVSQQSRAQGKRKSIGTLSTFSGPTKSVSDSLGSFSDRDTAFSVRDSTIAPSTATAAEVPVASTSTSSSSSSASTSFESSEDSDSEEEGDERSLGKSDGASEGCRSKKTASQMDSDAWHSESEANWTLVDASCRNGRDITQSQVLSEVTDAVNYNDEVMTQRRPSVTFNESSVTQQKDMLPPFSEGEEEMVGGAVLSSEESPRMLPDIEKCITPLSPPPPVFTKEDGMEGYGFLPRRPVEIFGEISWNSLPLAISSNLVDNTEKRHHGKLSRENSAFMERVGLGDFCTEVKVLNQLVRDAAQATTVSGRLVATVKKTALNLHAARVKSAATVARKTSTPAKKSKSPASGAVMASPSAAPPPLEPNSPVPHQADFKSSRRVYGQAATTYPRPTSAWSKYKKHSLTANELSSSDNSPGFQKQLSAFDLQASVRVSRMRARSPRKSAKTRAATATGVDVFDREHHKDRQLQHLVSQTESALPSARISSIQALGQLPDINIMAMDKLRAKLVTDDDAGVRYQALCSLLKLGIVDNKVVESIFTFLSNGSPELQCDLLQLLCQKEILDACLQKDSNNESAIDKLNILIRDLVCAGEREAIRLHSAYLLSHSHLRKDVCIQCLKCLLQSTSPTHQNMALLCLLKCWHCCEEHVLAAAFKQITRFTNWKLRKSAVECMGEVAEDANMQKFKGAGGRGVTELLAKRLTDEPVLEVRIAIGNLLRLLKVASKVESSFLSELESKDEVVRKNAVLALAGFELKEKKTVNHLLECVNFDPSAYIRIQVIRLLGEMRVSDPKVIETLRNKCRGQDTIARECIAALQKIHNKGIER